MRGARHDSRGREGGREREGGEARFELRERGFARFVAPASLGGLLVE